MCFDITGLFDILDFLIGKTPETYLF